MNQVQWMEAAFALAAEAAADGEIPVGAVIADREGRIIGRGRNRRESGDPLGHAEMYAIAEAARAIGDWRPGSRPTRTCTPASSNAAPTAS